MHLCPLTAGGNWTLAPRSCPHATDPQRLWQNRELLFEASGHFALPPDCPSTENGPLLEAELGRRIRQARERNGEGLSQDAASQAAWDQSGIRGEYRGWPSASAFALAVANCSTPGNGFDIKEFQVSAAAMVNRLANLRMLR